MRYLCNKCNKMIKDKFIFGLLHACPLSEYEIRMRGIYKKEIQARSIDEYNDAVQFVILNK